MNTTTRERAGLGLTGAVAVFLVVDAAMHIANIEVVRTSMAELGCSEGRAPTLGVIELVCIALYLWRWTELLGAVLLTAYLGGAIASNLRVDKPLISTVMFPVCIAIAAWGGLYCRNLQLRTIVHDMTRRERRAATAVLTGSEVAA
jgi:DoxX-like family